MAELVGKRYATALYEAAFESGVLDKVQEELQEISNIYQQVKDFRIALEHPKLSKSEKKQIIKTLFSDKVSEITLNFLYVLIDKTRERNILQIQESFEERYLEEKGIVKVDAISAVPLKEEEKQQLIQRLSQKLNKEIRLENTVNEGLIGGVLLKMKDQVIDYSIKGTISSLRQTLIEKRL